MKSEKQPFVPQPGVDYEILSVSDEEAKIKCFFKEAPPVTQTVVVRKTSKGRAYIRVRFGASVRRIYL